MKRIFCDVDDTLVLYQKVGPNQYGVYMGTPFVVNERLVAGLLDLRVRDPWTLIVVWSGGGKEYAKMWMRCLGLDKIAVGMLKDETTFPLIQEGDVVIDDDPLGGRRTDQPARRTHKPDEWPE